MLVMLDKNLLGTETMCQFVEHYKHMSLAQIHAAFSHYYEHQEQMDAEIQRQLGEVEALRRAASESPFVSRMRQLGRLP